MTRCNHNPLGKHLSDSEIAELTTDLHELLKAFIKDPTMDLAYLQKQLKGHFLFKNKFEGTPDLLRAILSIDLQDDKPIAVMVGMCRKYSFDLSTRGAFSGDVLQTAIKTGGIDETHKIIYANGRPLCVTNGLTNSFQGCAVLNTVESKLFAVSLALFLAVMERHKKPVTNIVALSAQVSKIISGNSKLEVATSHTDVPLANLYGSLYKNGSLPPSFSCLYHLKYLHVSANGGGKGVARGMMPSCVAIGLSRAIAVIKGKGGDEATLRSLFNAIKGVDNTSISTTYEEATTKLADPDVGAATIARDFEEAGRSLGLLTHADFEARWTNLLIQQGVGKVEAARRAAEMVASYREKIRKASSLPRGPKTGRPRAHRASDKKNLEKSQRIAAQPQLCPCCGDEFGTRGKRMFLPGLFCRHLLEAQVCRDSEGMQGELKPVHDKVTKHLAERGRMTEEEKKKAEEAKKAQKEKQNGIAAQPQICPGCDGEFGSRGHRSRLTYPFCKHLLTTKLCRDSEGMQGELRKVHDKVTNHLAKGGGMTKEEKKRKAKEPKKEEKKRRGKREKDN
ncbi:hypothetical protein TrCOL_g4954 [Triparma columacea]|uniref:Uncharacterized protein n=1 Tax=Triparma columacea TaxID=722753 RepID=A0A9W7FX69_9STRA|nr:hypothetical protein TrCOL_g4954 [Triparma columacea]